MAEHVRSVPGMLGQYKELIKSFVQDEISADEFERRYIQVFTNDKFQVQGAEFITLEKLFFAVDDYVSDPRLRDSPEDLSGEQLRDRAKATYAELYGS